MLYLHMYVSDRICKCIIAAAKAHNDAIQWYTLYIDGIKCVCIYTNMYSCDYTHINSYIKSPWAATACCALELNILHTHVFNLILHCSAPWYKNTKKSIRYILMYIYINVLIDICRYVFAVVKSWSSYTHMSSILYCNSPHLDITNNSVISGAYLDMYT